VETCATFPLLATFFLAYSCIDKIQIFLNSEEVRMKKVMFLAVVFTMFFAVSVIAAEDPIKAAAKGAVQTFAEGCQKELETYCKDVTPGKGRILACIYAHEDKLSSRCEYALYDSAAQLERALNALTYVAKECHDDLKNNCSKVKPGEGRLLDCLEKNKAKVSQRCKQAVKDAGLKK
jgi:hypothetical protein